MATRKRAKKAAKKATFPSSIYVTREGEGEDSYLNVVGPSGLEGIDEEKPVAVYELVRVGNLVIKKELK